MWKRLLRGMQGVGGRLELQGRAPGRGNLSVFRRKLRGVRAHRHRRRIDDRKTSTV